MTGPLFAHPGADEEHGGVGAAVQVALPVPVDTLFSYSVPPAMRECARPGHRVLVAFRGRRLVGVIVEPAAPRDGLAALERVLDREPVVSGATLAILRDAADDVACPVGLALTAALPPGGAPRGVETCELTARGRAARASGAARATAAALLERLASAAPAARTEGALVRLAPDAAAALRTLERDGLVTRRNAWVAAPARPATVRTVSLRAGVDAARARDGALRRAPRLAEVLERVASAGRVDLPELTARDPRAPERVRDLARRGLVELGEREVPRDVLGPPVARDRPPELTPEQAAAFEPIRASIERRACETFLLHGVTGSGKTEVYLRAVAAALDAGRQALVLVPEITLTHQIVARLRARFGERVAVLHSGLRPGERLEQWERLRRGDTPIAVGARSALFAPLERLGVLVIDEEHDGAYKNDEGFRYHARNLAGRLARAAACPLVLGTATPSLETRHAAERGALRRLELPRRIGGRPLPAVEVVDLARERERAPRGRKLVVTRPLRRALEETLADGGQAILFLNRRGFSTQILCFECGHAERCKDCDIALVYHASEQRLRCHYCGFRKRPPERCEGCGAPDAALLGVGTQRLEEELRGLLPRARIARLDRDTARRRGYTEAVLADLRDGRLDVLVGTQIVAKGHDFPGVRLVGVVAADLGLHLPDFRAAERTFQLLTQVAGRAGRDAAPGRVVLQTFVPDHYAIRPVREHDYEAFYAEELGHRAALGYPPFGRLARVLVSSRDEAAARRAADALAGALRAPPGPDEEPLAGAELLGPAPAPLARLRGRHRVQLLVKHPDAVALRRAAHILRAAASRLPREVQASVDVDPVDML